MSTDGDHTAPGTGLRTPIDFEPLLDEAREAFFLKDLSGRYRYINRTGARMLDRTPDQVLGRTDADIFLPDTAAEIAAIDAEVAASGAPYTYRPTRHDFGEPRVFQTTKYPFLQDGVVVGVLGVSVDVSELVETHERAQSLEAQLAKSDRLATVGTMAAGVAHEINTPLFVVRHNLERLQEALADEPELLAMAEAALQGTDRVAAIVQDLTGFSRPGDDPVGPVDLPTVLEQALRLTAHLFHGEVRVERRLAPVPPVRARAGRMGQVLLNLLANAAQAVQEGGGSERSVVVETRQVGDQVELSVRDSGPGIPESVLPRVFEQFFTTKGRGEGSGLGLWLVRGYVEETGGRITLANAPGGGAVATVRMPVSTERASVPSRAAPRAAATPTKRPLDVVIVDDDLAMRRMLEEALGMDVSVRTFASVREAVPALREEPPDVIVCDLMMPDLTGMDLHAHLVAEQPELAARMLFLTGGAFTAEGHQFTEEHAERVLSKPLRMRDLLAAVRAMAQGRLPG